MSTHQNTALIVDDEEVIRYVFSNHLDRLGYRCVAASGGEEALEQLERQDFHLVVLDVKMPGMSGLEVLKTMRPHHPNTCVVMLSALVDADIAAAALNMGADNYITKPCSLDYLRVRLKASQEQRNLARQAETERFPDEDTERKVSFAEVTEDLIRQQIALFERLTSRPTDDDRS